MQASLAQFIQKLREGNKTQSLSTLDEAQAKQSLVLPLLQQLGWDVFNTNEVRPEQRVRGPDSDTRVDYALKDGDGFTAGDESKWSLFVEVKRPNEDLGAHENQLLDYAFKSGVALAALTNGIEWWLYLPLKQATWEERRFYAINILEMEESHVIDGLNQFLSKGAVVSGSAVEVAGEFFRGKEKNRAIQRSLPEAWMKLISDPDEELIELIANKTQSHCGYRPTSTEVKEFIERKLLPRFRSPGKESRMTTAPKPGDAAGQKRHGGRVRGAVVGHENLVNRRAESFVFQGETHGVVNWRDLLLKVCSLVYQAHTGDFFERVKGIRGRKRTYFSLDPSVQCDGIQIPGSPIFVECNFSAKSIVKLCHDVLGKFDYPSSLLEIRCQD